MKNLILFLAVTLAAVFTPALSQSTSAGPGAWPPLLSCPDVNGDGQVAIGDFLAVIRNYGHQYQTSGVYDYDYHLLYDLNGDQAVEIGDFYAVLQDYSKVCDPVESQVARAAIAANKYESCTDAEADGFGQSGVYVPNMGIHISSLANMSSTFDIDKPFGLVCTKAGGGTGVGPVDRLIGLWYIIPTTSTCALYGLSGACQAADEMPEGFAGPEDNLPGLAGGPPCPDIEPPEPSCIQQGWHTHVNLCVGEGFLNELGEGPTWMISTSDDPTHDEAHRTTSDPTHHCVNHLGGAFIVPLYGWMLHLYTNVPNPTDRFMRWNTNSCFINGC